MSDTQTVNPPTQFEVRFDPLFNAGCGLAFPCDEAGRVDLDALSERARNSSFYARAMLCRQYAIPRVVSRGSASV